ncbi:nucleoside phosphorylase domain-containing protein [Copromyces sp. CBS 386.78]|nr:nucleoside phosphorylase domain-containing protein [Copromyces sp. CBS 386.78]
MGPPPDTARYTVGWIAPLPVELTAALGLLEDRTTMEVPGDDATYHVGRIGNHFVVIVVCPSTGIIAASIALTNMRRSFRNIRHILVVGTAGGVPSYGPDMEEQIVLGDVVVGIPHHGTGGVTHYEFGAWEAQGENGTGDSVVVKAHTLHPSAALLGAVNNLRSAHMMVGGSKIPQYLQELRKGLIDERTRQRYEDPGAEHDYLFEGDHHHPDGSKGKSCEGLCDTTKRAKRREDRDGWAERERDRPEIHYGNIGSASAVVRSAAKRDELYARHKIICFEMEGAGVVSDHQALVIRGICNYADSHKNKKWQGYAAATAAAYAKEVLLLVPSGKRLLTESSSIAGDRDGNSAREYGSGRRDAVHNSGAGLMNFITYELHNL